MMRTQTTLLDGANPPPQMFHVQIVPDPFAATEAGPVLMGGPPGPANTTTANKASLLNAAGFFQVPAGQSQLRLFVAVRGPRQLRIEVLAAPTGKAIYQLTLPAENGWQEVVLPIDHARLPAGAMVNDVTVFQLGPDGAAELYIRALTLRTY